MTELIMDHRSNASSTAGSAGRVLPRVMLFLSLLNLVLCFVPLDAFTFRAWETVRRFPNAVGPFTPNKHYHRDNSYGVVASTGNLPALRRYYAADFSTDAYGFHNPPALAQPRAAGMVIGDSFAVGGELREDQTLSAQLTRISGGYFYNAGSLHPLCLRSTQAVAQRLGLHRGLVVYELLESHVFEEPPAATPDGSRGWVRPFFFSALGTTWTDRLRTPLNVLYVVSPMQALSVKLEKRLQDNVLLPNSFAAFVIQDKLSNGEAIGFLPHEFTPSSDPREAAEQWAVYFTWYAGELRKEGLDFVVLLVPNRSTIYAPFLAHPRDVSTLRAALDEFAQRLAGADVPLVHLMPRYDREARALYNGGAYLYMLDDTHWNGCGTYVAAAEIVAHIPRQAWASYRANSAALGASMNQVAEAQSCGAGHTP